MSRRKGEAGEMPLWMPLFMVVAALALAVVLLSMLRQDAVSNDTAADRAFRSALLPDGWTTYMSSVWSVGYPGDWQFDVVQGGITFMPEDANGATGETYFTFMPDTRSIEEITAVYEAVAENQPGLEKSEFLFAGYPAMKYTYPSPSTREEYYISYGTRVFNILTDYPDDPEVGIMLATFQFNVKE